MPRSLLPLTLLVLLAMPSSAQAWTEAAVRTVRALVVVEPDATAHVTLTAMVRVHGGWLEALELAGLDPDLELDEEMRPYAVDESGTNYPMRADVLHGGRIQLAFPGRSPRRGRLTVGVAYRTNLAHRMTAPSSDGEHVQVRWTLPPWRTGLDGVEIELVLPPGARPAVDQEPQASVEKDIEALAGGTRIRFRRAHLPRTVSWTVAADVPAEAMAEELRGAPPIRSVPPPSPPRTEAVPTLAWFAWALALALLACAKIRHVTTLARRSRVRARPLLPLPAWFRTLVALAGALSGGWLGPREPHLALALVALAALMATHLAASPEAPSRLGAWHPADPRWIRAARRNRFARALSPSTLLDGTSPLGIILLGASSIAPWALPFSLEVRIALSVLALPILLTGIRTAFPSGPMDTLATLLGLAQRMRSLPEGVGLAPVVHVDVRGQVQDARVRTVLARRPRGLLRLDFALAEAARAGGYSRGEVLLVVTRASSPAEAALTEALPEVETTSSPGGRRVLRTLPIDELDRVVRALADCPEAPPVSRGTASEHETVHQLPSPRAVGF